MQKIDVLDFDKIMQQANDAIFSTNESFVITSWNAAAEKLYGFTAKEAIGIKLSLLLKGEMPGEHQGVELYSLQRNGSYQGNYKFVTKSGKAIYVYVFVTVLRDSENRISGYVAMHQQLFGQKKVEERLRVFSAILENQKVVQHAQGTAARQVNINPQGVFLHLTNLPLAIIGWDTALIITSWSKQAQAIFGWTEAEAVGSSIEALRMVYDQDLNEVEAIIGQLLNGSIASIKSINRNYTKTGKVIYCEWYNSVLKDDDGKVISCLSFVQDVTEKRTAEVALSLDEQQLNLIYNSGSDILFLIQVEGDRFRFLSVNDAFEKATGLTSDKVLNRYVEDVIPYPSSDIVIEKYKEAVKCRRQVMWEEETEYPAGVKMGLVSVTPVYDSDGVCIRLVGSVHDITSSKIAEAELREKNEQLRNLSAYLQEVREEERADIAREIHDELGERLTGIRLDISWLQNHMSSSPQNIQKKFPDLLQLVDDTIKTVRKISSELRPSILDDFGLVDALEWQAGEFEKRTGINCEVKSFLKRSINNKKIDIILFRIFQESLTNVLRHAKAKNVFAQLLEQNNIIELTISDDGIGMHLEEVKHKKTLGLIGMKERVLMVNGDYHITSEIGIGTTITVSVPCV